MRAEAWLVAALLVASVPLAPAQESLPPDCVRTDPDTVTCRWTHVTTPDAAPFVADLPVGVGLSLATFVVTLLDSPDTGWVVSVHRVLPDGGERLVSAAVHEARPTTAMRHHDESTHVLEAQERDAFRLRLVPGRMDLPGLGQLEGQPWRTGVYEVAFVAQRAPNGEIPSRPAATLADPQLPDDVREVADPAWDVQAAWLDDASVADGLFEAHLAVGSLVEISHESFAAPIHPLNRVPGGETSGTLAWKLAWRVEERAYYVEWSLSPRALDDGLIEASEFRCALRTESDDPSVPETTRAHPLCHVDMEAAILHATLPEAAIGAPGYGVLFTDLAARTRVGYDPDQWDVVDQADRPRYLFALGGPLVWSALNPRLDPPPGPAWYQAPLAPENAADTLQVVGTFAALATFLVGLLLVWRRRRHTSRLLARIDAVEDAGVDAPNVLLALGRLEQEFAVLFRRHRISEAQYQVLSQRIATVATRHALRRQLGLDDGIPGAPADAPPAEGATRLRVR